MAPTRVTASAVAMNELAGTMTSSPGPIPFALQGQREGVRPGGHPDCLPRAAVGSEFLLEGRDLVAERERRLGRHPLDRRHQLLEERGIAVVEQHERDRGFRSGVDAISTGAVTTKERATGAPPSSGKKVCFEAVAATPRRLEDSDAAHRSHPRWGQCKRPLRKTTRAARGAVPYPDRRTRRLPSFRPRGRP